MNLTLLLFASLGLVNAREQQILSVGETQIKKVTLYHHRPWTILFSKQIHDSSCTVLTSPEPAQIHRSVTEPGDVIVLNKTLSTMDAKDGVNEHTFEIIGFDEHALWTQLFKLCDSIEYQYSSEASSLAEYEVVQALWNSANTNVCRENYTIPENLKTESTSS
jgi:hypothetical protein